MHPQNAQGDIWSSFIFLGMLMLAVYFLLLRPQNKRTQDHKKLLDSLKVGDEVTTTAGIMGKIHKISKDGVVELTIAKDTVIAIQQHAVMTMLPKGTVKQF